MADSSLALRRPSAARPPPVRPRLVRGRVGHSPGVTATPLAETVAAAAARPDDPTPGDLVALAAAVAGDAGRALALARQIGTRLAVPGRGRTARRWALLRDLAAADLTAARVAEAHTDALAILAEDQAAGGRTSLDADRAAAQLWGVFAAEGPGVRVDAQPAGDGWGLSGTKPWCSLADRLDRALITAHLPGGGRRLFAIDLTGPHVRVDPPTGWYARGLVQVSSTAVHLDRCPAEPVGADGWYLTRSGFAWGGMGVAACWLGGAIGVARALHRAVRAREPDQIGLMHLGAIDAALTAGQHLLDAAAAAVDDGRADGPAGALWAARVRAVVAGTVDTVLTRVGHALGPAPLAFDDDHARRVADLQLYVRQQHAERDDAALGALVRDRKEWP